MIWLISIVHHHTLAICLQRITMGKGAAKGYLDTEYGTDVFIHLPGSARRI